MNYLNANGFSNWVPLDNFNSISLEGIRSLQGLYPSVFVCISPSNELLQLVASSNEEASKYQSLIYSPIIYINNMIYKGDFYNQ